MAAWPNDAPTLAQTANLPNGYWRPSQQSQEKRRGDDKRSATNQRATTRTAGNNAVASFHAPTQFAPLAEKNTSTSAPSKLANDVRARTIGSPMRQRLYALQSALLLTRFLFLSLLTQALFLNKKFSLSQENCLLSLFFSHATLSLSLCVIACRWSTVPQQEILVEQQELP